MLLEFWVFLADPFHRTCNRLAHSIEDSLQLVSNLLRAPARYGRRGHGLGKLPSFFCQFVSLGLIMVSLGTLKLVIDPQELFPTAGYAFCIKDQPIVQTAVSVESKLP